METVTDARASESRRQLTGVLERFGTMHGECARTAFAIVLEKAADDDTVRGPAAKTAPPESASDAVDVNSPPTTFTTDAPNNAPPAWRGGVAV